jgi:hypothetical protein
MAVDDFSEVKDGLAIHRKVEMVVERGENNCKRQKQIPTG